MFFKYLNNSTTVRFYSGQGTVPYKQAADRGNAVAQYNLSKWYLQMKKFPEALHYLRLSADQGNPFAQYNLGKWHYEGKGGIELSRPLAIKYLKMAADQNISGAQLNLAIIYDSKEEHMEALRYWKLCAKEHQLAAYKAAQYYEHGIGVSIDLSKSLEYFKIAAEKNYPQALYRLGLAYEYGHLHLEKNMDLAIEFYTKSAELQYKPSYYRIGLYHETINDIHKAIEWYKRDLENIKCLIRLGTIYETGLCRVHDNNEEENLKEALKYYLKATEQHNTEASILAGSLFEKMGKFSDAFNQFKIAASRGDLPAIYRVAEYYENGIHGTKNLELAFENYKYAAVLGHTESELKVAEFNEKGIGVSKNKTPKAVTHRLD